MTDNLWCENSPQNFWLCDPNPQDHIWQEAIQNSLPILGLDNQTCDIKHILHSTLGEGQFGPEHWRLSRLKRLYYHLKPLLPRAAIDAIKNYHSQFARDTFPLKWPIEDRYVQFQWDVLKQVLIISGGSSMKFRHLWPEGRRFAFVLTHDIETKEGQAFVREIADLEEEFGFRSSFNFVPERYTVDRALMDELRQRGFEIGVHGLKHDGKLFYSRRIFMDRAKKINHYLREFGAVGYRSPLMMRNPEWMQALEIEYDLSFFDTDPYEPMPGGCMSIWPFMIEKFVELPYTLPQDCTLTIVLGQNTPKLWFEKLDFIQQYYGMALLNTHPDYLSDPVIWKVYADFLQTMQHRDGYWHALPREVAQWWRARAICAIGMTDLFQKQVSILWENGDRESSGVHRVGI